MATGNALEAIQQHKAVIDRQRMRMEHNLQEAFREFRLEFGIQAAMETLAQDCYSLALESGSWNQQEQHEVTAIVAECARRLESYDK